MSFAELYKFADTLAQFPVRLEGVLDSEVKRLTSQDELYYVPVELDPEISLGHIKQYRIPALVYDDDPSWVTEIRYHLELNICWQRFVCCKELMHCFDNNLERVNDPEKFEQLLSEIEAPLPTDESSPMYKTEVRTLWMAVAVLCPEKLRSYFKAKWEADEMSAYEIALQLRVPDAIIRPIMRNSYDRMIPFLNERLK